VYFDIAFISAVSNVYETILKAIFKNLRDTLYTCFEITSRVLCSAGTYVYSKKMCNLSLLGGQLHWTLIQQFRLVKTIP